MPMPGPNPKPNARRTNAPVVEWTEVLDVPFADPPRLPRQRVGGKSWPTRTKAWWKAISTMPHCVRWSDGDWSFAIDTAMLAAEFHESGTSASAAELRQREKIMGTTMDARRALRIRYLQLEQPTADVDDGVAPAPVAQLDDYRDLYGE